jgi:hypothetical protein
MSLFDFEQDFAHSLRCIPMSVRLKLDCCGVKLKLHQWMKFAAEQRQGLVDQPCQDPEQIQTYKKVLCELIEKVCQEEAKCFEPDPNPAWNQLDQIPEKLQNKASEHNIVISLVFWRQLEQLQRFALFKLSQPGHENRNFLPALQEFGLLK